MNKKTHQWLRRLLSKSFLLLGLFVLILLTISNFSGNWSMDDKSIKAINVKFYDEEIFREGVEAAQDKPSNFPGGKIIGGIVPHHTLAGDMISSFMLQVSKQEPKKIIVLGPNHHESGAGPFITSDLDWQTPFGLLSSDMNLAHSLSSYVSVDNSVIENEHSVSAMMPYIKYYFGEVKVIPLVVSNRVNTSLVEEFANELDSYIDEETLVIGAFDFSHYLELDDANRNDEYTLSLIKEYSYPKVVVLDNGFTDSPVALSLLLYLMQKRDSVVNVESHSNSLNYMSELPGGTTSYFVISFTE